MNVLHGPYTTKFTYLWVCTPVAVGQPGFLLLFAAFLGGPSRP